MLDWTAQRVIVTGGAGFLGRHVVAALEQRGVSRSAIFVPRSRDFDLTTAGGASRLLTEVFAGNPPTVIIHAAGFSGGLAANRTNPARFFFDNLAMGLHLIEAARSSGFAEHGTFLQVGTMCSYPGAAPQPYREDDLFNGFPDPEIAPYGVAKLALLQMLEAYRLQYRLRSAYVIPSNLYGPGDNLSDPARSHAAGSFIRRFVEAATRGDSEVVCWGSGAPLRDFLYAQDAAEGIVRAAEVVGGDEQAQWARAGMYPINLASGNEVSIRALAETVARLAGFQGRISWDTSKGEGVARRALDAGRALKVLGWKAQTPLEEGLTRTIAWYRTQPHDRRSLA